MNTAEDVIFTLIKYFNIKTIEQLSEKINVPSGTIHSWKNRNSLKSVISKCKKLGIYSDIFLGDDSANGDNTIIININKQLKDFNRRSLMMLYFLFKDNKVKDAISLNNVKSTYLNENKFKRFIKLFNVDFTNDNVSFDSSLKDLKQYSISLLQKNEINFLFQNPEKFQDFVLLLIKNS